MAKILTRWALGRQPEESVSDADFQSISDATSDFRVALDIEEKFDLVLSNYVEYEMELISLALGDSIFRGVDWSSMRIDSHRVVRRVVNVLTSTRLYVDQVQHALSGQGSSVLGVNTDLKPVFAGQYDRRLGYRVMEAMRNVVQHESTAFVGLRCGMNTVGTASQLHRFRADAVVDTTALKTTSFKRKVLNELGSLGSEFSMSVMMRDYLEGLAVAHESIRSMCTARLAASESVIRAAAERGRQLLGDKPMGLCLVAREHSRPSRPVFINTHLIDQHTTLIRKNCDLSTLSKRFVTSEVP